LKHLTLTLVTFLVWGKAFTQEISLEAGLNFSWQQHIVKANFAFDKELIALVKKQRGVRWSQTLKCWFRWV